MQQITVTGFLSRDAETRQTQNGQSVTTLNIPVRQGWGDKEQTNWFRASVWGKRADFAGKFRKGDFVCVTGELSIGEYQGKPQYEISASDFDRRGDKQAADKQPADNGGWQGQAPADDLDDQIPY